MTVLVKDPRKEQTWRTGSVAELSRLKSYVVVLNDERGWKRHLDHIGRNNVDSAVLEEKVETRAQDEAPDPIPQAILRPGAPFPH